MTNHCHLDGPQTVSLQLCVCVGLGKRFLQKKVTANNQQQIGTCDGMRLMKWIVFEDRNDDEEDEQKNRLDQ